VIGLVLGAVIATSFKGCGNGDISEPKVEYIEKIVEVPVEKIVYKEGPKEYIEVPVKIYIPVIDSITGDTTYIEKQIEAEVPTVDREFKYETDSLSSTGDSLSITGDLSIQKDSTEGYLFPKLDNLQIKYTEKQTTVVKKRTFGLYAGAGLGLYQWDLKSVSLDLDLTIKQRTIIGTSIEKPLVSGSEPIYWIRVKRSIFK